MRSQEKPINLYSPENKAVQKGAEEEWCSFLRAIGSFTVKGNPECIKTIPIRSELCYPSRFPVSCYKN
jgi:hypothetical protein